jgi:hypothetical protein
MPQKTISDLNKEYTTAESTDNPVFADQRSNVRLVNGDHFTKTNKHYWQRIRETSQFPHDQKVRITQNHIHNISKTYVNSILSLAQDAIVKPNNESEMQDQKCADLNNSVWHDIKKKNHWETKKAQLASDFVDLGEVAVKVFFDKDGGEIVDYEPELGQDGTPLVDEFGQVVKGDTPIRTGQIKIDRIFAFNLLRDPSAKSKEECKYLIVRYMAELNDVKKWVEGDSDKLKFVQQSTDETYKVFNGTNGEFEDSKNQVMVREYYYKPCVEYPNGYYYITTSHGILFEGELPFGIFPIVWTGFDDIQTSARSRSLIKQLRSFQAEINRAVSYMVEIQLSNGMDKIFMQGGGKISPMQYAPGVRAYSTNGPPPMIVEGRAGDQFLNYLNMQIDRMYQVARIEELPIEKAAGLDAYTMLFLNARQKKVYSSYATKFGNFLNDVCELTLKLAKSYYTPQMVIPIVGKREAVNIQEFLNTEPFGYTIEIVEGSDDAESTVGKQMALNQFMQYAGSQLTPEVIGKLARNSPYLNKEDLFDDLTLDYDTARDQILALDRGETPLPNRHDNHSYMIKKLTNRMRKSDFKLLSQDIQQNYEEYKQLHEEFEMQIQKQLQLAQSGFIPATGPLVNVEFYINTPDGKTQRAKIPSDAVRWLIEKLESQGSYYERFKELNPADQADMAQMLLAQPGNGLPGSTNGFESLQGSLPNPQGLGVF